MHNHKMKGEGEEVNNSSTIAIQGISIVQVISPMEDIEKTKSLTSHRWMHFHSRHLFHYLL